MPEASRKMVISSLWFQMAILTFAIGFGVLSYLAYRIYDDHPPVPARVVDEGGAMLFTGDDVVAGQQVFQKYGLMQYGTIFGHGAYLGPDFTAQYLRRAIGIMKDFYGGKGEPPGEVEARIRRELKENAYRPDTGTLAFSPGL